MAVRVARSRRTRTSPRRTAGIAMATSAAGGFPAPAHVFVLGLSDRRLLVWRATRWLARPAALAGAVGLDDVAGVGVVHRFTGTRLQVTLNSGPSILLEPVWGGSLRAVSDTFAMLRHGR